MDGAPSIQAALKAVVDAVKAGEYPKEEHTYA
jgi:ketopantoate hydroxymethyltransferase